MATCCFLSILAMGVDLWGQAQHALAPVNAAEPADPNKPMPLVNADEEIANYLSQAQKLIQQKNYSRAIEIIQTILNRQDIGFVGTADGRRYLSLGAKINELLGQLGPEGIKTYRDLYDPQAQRLYEQAIASGDASMLGRIIGYYRYTSYGPRALEMLAAAEFDAGRFLQAAKFWEDRLTLCEPTDKPMLLMKAAVAHHLAGQEALANKALAALEKDYSAAAGAVGGREQNLLAFARNALTLPPCVPPPTARDDWPGLGGAGGRPALMNDSDVVLAGRWRYPADAPAAGEEAQNKLLVSNLLPGVGSPMYESSMMPRDGRRPMSVKLRGGHLRTQANWNGRNVTVTLPPTLTPVVAGQTAIFRTRTQVVGCDLLTGKEIWSADLPMERSPKAQPNGGGYYYGGYMGNISDTGQYMLTVGEDKAFAVAAFRPETLGMYYAGPRGNQQEPDSSELVALSIPRQGARVWSVGRGTGDTELLQNGKYFSVPTYCDGRLYVVVLYLESYHLACLDAQSGHLIWKATVSQVPTLSRTYGMPTQLFRGSPPVVADGKVFVLTNGGVVAAFDARNGQAAWAYQYDSELNKGQGMMYVHGRGDVRVISAPSPVVVGRDRIVVLPCDTQQVLCLSAEDGKSLWTLPRQDQADMSAIDSDRLLLSGDKLVVLSMADGKVLHATDKLGINGRPAVAPNAVLACGDVGGEGRLIRMSLQDYALRTVELADGGAILGNLVSVGGKLLASNALGASLYMDYDAAVAELNTRLRVAKDAEKVEVHFDLARLSFNAHRFDTTLDALNRCKALCDADSPVGLQLVPWYYRTYVAMGNLAATPDEMVADYQKALAFASSAQEKGHLAIRIAKAQERAGRYAQAFAEAQAISEQFANEQLADVEIGPRDMLVRLGSGTTLVPGRKLGQDLVQEFIEKNGREGYKPFDDRAKGDMDKAVAAGDPEAILKVYETWPHSVWAPAVVFAAAEAFYRRAGGDDKDANLVKARELLELVTRLAEDKNLKLSASAALAVLWTRAQSKIMARLVREDIPDSALDQQVKFADIQGTLRDVLNNLDRKPASRPAPQPVSLQLPLKKKFTIEDPSIYVVREVEGAPIWTDGPAIGCGSRILAEKDGQLFLLDLAAVDAKHALVGPGVDLPSRKDKAASKSYRQPLRAALGRDGKTAAVCDGKWVAGIDLVTGEKKWPAVEVSTLGLGVLYSGAGGAGFLALSDRAGQYVLLDAATGQALWGPTTWYQKNRGVSYAFLYGERLLVFRADLKRLLCVNPQNGKLLGELPSFAPPATLSKGSLVAIAADKKSLVVWDLIEMKQTSRPFEFPSGGLLAFAACGKKEVLLAVNANASYSGIENTRSTGVSPSSKSGPAQIVSVFENKSAPLDIGKNPVQTKAVHGRQPDGRAFLLVSQHEGSKMLMDLRAFDVENGKPMWTAPIPVEGATNAECWLAGKDHLVVQVKNYVSTPTVNYHILAAADGKTAEKIASGCSLEQQEARVRLMAIGAPVVVGGRLVVETMEGVNVYGN